MSEHSIQTKNIMLSSAHEDNTSYHSPVLMKITQAITEI